MMIIPTNSRKSEGDLELKPTYESSKRVSLNTAQQMIGGQECRICLETLAQAPEKIMISPCECTGSIKFVHDQCLKEWLLSCLKKKNFRESVRARREGIECQMCKRRIKFHYQKTYRCCTCEQFYVRVQRKKFLFILAIVLLMISSAGIGYSVYLLAQGRQNIEDEENVNFATVLALCGIFLTFLFFVIGMVTLIKDILLKQEEQIVRIGQRVRSRNEVYPQEQISNLQIHEMEE